MGIEKELELLLDKYPEVEDITFTMRQSKVVKRTPFKSKTDSFTGNEKNIESLPQEDMELSDVHTAVLLGKIKDIKTDE